MLPNATQVQTTTASVIAAAAGYAAGHGWLGLGAADWGSIFGSVVLLGSALWPLVVTRVQALKNQVGKSGALVVTSADSAKALPDNPNVVAPSEVTPARLATVK